MNKLLGGRYTVGEMIGTGGMADVYLGYDQRLSREVAIKILRSDLARDPSFLARFRKEALAAAGLNHPGIVAVYDSGEEGDNSYIVMELVNGQTLRDVLKSGQAISIDDSLRIVVGILDAIAYSHENGIIHRDIKPGNVMITDSGDIKVMDFGIARAMDDVGATMTSTWNVVGTAQYLSPEQATGEVADGRSDIYSVGCLLYELITGRPPFTGDTPVAIAYQHVSGELIPASEIVEDLDPGIDTILEVSLAKSPSDRYPSADEMLRDLRLVMSGDEVTTRIRRVVTRKSKQILVGLSLLFVLLLGTAYLIAPSPINSQNVIQLPNVVGLTESQAADLLQGFTINISRSPDSKIPVGRVATQLPLATSRVPQGSSISLTISSGPGDTAIPVDIIGKNLSEARNMLASVGLVIAQTIPVDSNSNPGVVLKVTPTPGSVIPAGSGVVLEIASGNLQIPSLVGLSEIEAKTILAQAGLLVKQVTINDSTQNYDVVLAQAPSAGSSEAIGSSVTITVNKKN
jgi:serine/threonine-protein kinase